MKLDNPRQAQEFLDTTISQYKVVGQALGTRTAINRCMYEGAQWIPGGFDWSKLTTSGRTLSNWQPDTNRILATLNRVARLIHECAAATFPDKMEFEVLPGPRETGVEGSRKAQVLEDTLNSMIESTGYQEAARLANFRRCIDGTHGIGWSIRVEQSEVPLRNGGTEQRYDQVLKAFTFDSTNLCLDPSVQKFDLHEHDFVIYTDVWTIDRIRRDLGLKDLDEKDFRTCGELRSAELNYNLLSQNRLYTALPMYSRTKGATVHQLHVKDEYGRFSTMLIGVKVPDKQIEWINWDSQESPFGGCGLPLGLLHAHRRPDSMWSVSDAAMLKDDQDRLNLLATFFFRMLQKNAGYQWRVAREALDGQDPDEFRSQFNNIVSGLVTWKSGTRDRPVAAPELIQYPSPPPFVENSIQMYQEEMRSQVHRPEITIGATKSHVPNSTYASAREAANQVLGNRIAEDIRRHEHFVSVGLGTYIKLAQNFSPSVLAELNRIGFGPDDFEVVAQASPENPACEIRMRESSIRYESKEQKEQRLWSAVDRQALDPMKLRIALADMDIPIDDSDRKFKTEAIKAASRVLNGETWEPITLGEYAQMFINAFRMAMFDKKAVNDPEARTRLEMAVQDQMLHEATAQGTMQQMANPQETQQQPQQETQQQQPEGDGPDSASVEQLLQAIQGASMQQMDTQGQAA